MTQPEIIIDYPMMRFDSAVQATRKEPGLSLEKMAKIIKSRLDQTELECLIEHLNSVIESLEGDI